jgi:hypothetical protein
MTIISPSVKVAATGRRSHRIGFISGMYWQNYAPTLTVNSPGEVIEITPPQLHMHLEEACRAGLLPIITVAEPGLHGALVTGTQGCGVSTPCAAAVADATCGLASELHMPKGAIFIIGALSMMVAAATLLPFTIVPGNTTREAGVVPNEHCIVAPFTTNCGMTILLFRLWCRFNYRGNAFLRKAKTHKRFDEKPSRTQTFKKYQIVVHEPSRITPYRL